MDIVRVTPENAVGTALPRIWCFISEPNHWTGDLEVSACAIIDGKFWRLASHVSSNVVWAKHDIGYDGNWKHKIYFEEFPNGFEIEWIDEPLVHPVISQYLKASEE